MRLTLAKQATWMAMATVLGAVSCGSDDDGGSKLGGGGSGALGSGASSGSGAGGGSAAASGSGAGGGSAASSGSGGTSGNGTGGNSGSGNAGTGGSAAGGGSGGLAAGFEECASEAREIEAVPVDIFMMIDVSVSMVQNEVSSGVTRWDALKEGLIEFVEAAESEGLRVGLQFFGLLEGGGQSTCDASAYATPEVELDFLPDNAEALVDAINAQNPLTLTPTYPALEGALMHATEWAEEHPERPTIVLLATDGYPTECGMDKDTETAGDNSSISDLADLAEQYASATPRIPTFVLGLGAVPNLKTIADRGQGTAFFVTDDDDAVENLGTALRRVINSPTVCEYDIPSPPTGETLDFSKVNVQFREGNGAPRVVYKIADSSQCGTSGGWYYDNNDDPTKIYVCKETCSTFGGAVVEVVLGCEAAGVR